MVSEPGFTTSIWCTGTVRPKLLRRVGPEQVAQIDLRHSVDQPEARNADNRIALGVPDGSAKNVLARLARGAWATRVERFEDRCSWADIRTGLPTSHPLGEVKRDSMTRGHRPQLGAWATSPDNLKGLRL